MAQANLTVRFHTPAFLGDAHQKGAWRTPPFKAELRQWWRIVLASQGMSWGSIRQREGELFGDAADNESRKSAVRLRLSAWRRGSLTSWAPRGGKDALQINSGANAVSADLYLGYGPIQKPKGKPIRMEVECAIAAEETNGLALAWPSNAGNGDGIPQALALMHRLGTVGSRSRNGWGSYELEPVSPVSLSRYAVHWRAAVKDDEAPRGIGADDAGLLIWSTCDPASTWEGVLQQLGEIRADLCGRSRDRGLLSNPVGNKRKAKWDDSDRVPNSLRFKVVRGDGGLYGLVYHMPCRPSDALWDKLSQANRDRFPDVWAQAHQQLDGNSNLVRVTD